MPSRSGSVSPNAAMSAASSSGYWSASEHERFLEATALYPNGPWRLITEYVGTRSIKQVQSHAQKFQEKLKRHQRGLRKRKTKVTRPHHRVDGVSFDQLMHACLTRDQINACKELSPHSPVSVSDGPDEQTVSPAIKREPQEAHMPPVMEPFPFTRAPLGNEMYEWHESEVQVLMETLNVVLH